jgi:hypothetical protein
MKMATTCALGAAAILVLAAPLLTPRLAAQPAEPPELPAGLDLAAVLDLGDFYVKPVPAEKDPKTGFVVGGKNDTALIRGLMAINGRTIAELEKDMRPGGASDVGSESGFLGRHEKLLDVLAADNRYVVEELGLTHQALAKHLHAVGTIGLWQHAHKKGETEFVYHGRKFKVKIEFSKGYQLSPFLDGTRTNSDATVYNLENGKTLHYSLLVPYMIERYGFYEGKGTPYRVDPRQVVSVIDFLTAKANKR